MNYFNYFTEIEEEFVKRRGSHMLVSPLDWSLMEGWQQRGVPLHVVLRGINNSFDGYDQKTSRGRKVNSLLYCQQEIEALFQEFCDSRVGGDSVSVESNGATKGNEEESSLPFTRKTINDFLREHQQHLGELSDRNKGNQALKETLERVSLRLEQIVEDLQTAKTFSPEALETDLTMIEEVILDGLKEAVTEAELKEIRREGNLKLREYKKSMGKEVYEQTLGNYVARRLREKFGVPRLSLFYL